MLSPMRTSSGFTLLELITAMGIVAILATIGVPSFRYVTSSSRVASEVNALLRDMQYARSEAIRQGLRISVCVSSDGATCTGGSAWQQGWLVFTDGGAQGTIDGTDAVLRVQNQFTGTDTMQPDNNASFVSFNRDGFATTLGGSRVFTLRDATANINYTRCLSASIVGALATQHYGQVTLKNTPCS